MRSIYRLVRYVAGMKTKIYTYERGLIDINSALVYPQARILLSGDDYVDMALQNIAKLHKQMEEQSKKNEELTKIINNQKDRASL